MKNQKPDKPGPMALLALALLVSSLFLAACGTPDSTPVPSDTPKPTGTQRPTFTPTSLARATKKATPTAKATQAPATATDTPEAKETEAAEATPTATEETPTPETSGSGRPSPRLRGTLILPIFDTNNQTYHLYRMDLASGEMEKWIEQASQPSITSDGTRIAWRSWDPDQRGLLSRPIEGGDIWPMITFAEAARPDWEPHTARPDSKPGEDRFVFPSRQEPDRTSRLYLYTGDGDEPFIEVRSHGSPVAGRVPTFLPDGRIVYQGCQENACGLFAMNLDGTNPLRLTQFKDDTAPAVSPDGTQIAYTSFSSGYWQISVVNADGSGQRRLTDDWFWNGLPTWAPDGKYILFLSNRDENWPNNLGKSTKSELSLWIMDADGRNQRQVNDLAFQVDGAPAGVAEHEAWGWIEERMIWLAE